MKIKKITDQYRRDFSAILVCEHCNNEQKLYGGYDDDNFHMNVIPNIKCKSCGEKSPQDYKPLATKYSSDVII